MNWKNFVDRLVLQILGSISGDLMTGLKDFAVKFRNQARKTTNPWDDVLADLICGLLGIPAETE